MAGTTDTKVKAKTVSLIVKIIDVIFIITCAVLKWKGVFENATIPEICMIGGVIGAVFGDISINTAIDKFTKREE
jgi:hypothetical protein